MDFETMLQEAQDAFWARVAAEYPEITTGDFPPDAQFALDRAMKEAVEAWLAFNQPEADADHEGHPMTDAEYRDSQARAEGIDLMAAAIRESVATWERGENASPDARDLVYFAGRAVGIGTAHADISEALVDDFEAYWQEGHTEPELATWLAARWF